MIPKWRLGQGVSKRGWMDSGWCAVGGTASRQTIFTCRRLLTPAPPRNDNISLDGTYKTMSYVSQF